MFCADHGEMSCAPAAHGETRCNELSLCTSGVKEIENWNKVKPGKEGGVKEDVS